MISKLVWGPTRPAETRYNPSHNRQPDPRDAGG
jgi:hypothetical protein